MTPNEYGRWYKRLTAALATVGMTVTRDHNFMDPKHELHPALGRFA